jgi:hypothetical protein
MSRQYQNAEKYYNEALTSADLAGKEFVELKALVMTKLTYMTFKRKMYLKAFNMYNESKFLVSLCLAGM